MSLDDLQNWRRLRNVLLEALRLYPPVPQILRDANGPDDICGETIGVDTKVWISPSVMHRHRKFWDRPTAFLPDRFAGKTTPWTQTPAYIPFGAGPRICIGLSFALSEAQIVMAQLLSRHNISLRDARPVLPVGTSRSNRLTNPCFGWRRREPRRRGSDQTVGLGHCSGTSALRKPSNIGASLGQDVARQPPFRRLRPKGERGSYVRGGKVVSLEQGGGKVSCLGERIGGAIDDVQLRFVTCPLP